MILKVKIGTRTILRGPLKNRSEFYKFTVLTGITAGRNPNLPKKSSAAKLSKNWGLIFLVFYNAGSKDKEGRAHGEGGD